MESQIVLPQTVDHGIPRKHFRNFANAINSNVKSSLYFPQANGEAERTV